MIYPVKKVYITQEWGVNPDVYSRFGFKGHNGVDFRIFDENGNKSSTGKLYSPHSGIVKEAYFDGDGYGHYYKIENDKEGSILAHNSELFFKVGDEVKEGQHIGTTGNTGWSTGPHLHWGYYRFPRDRQNGYGGTINQLPFLNGEGEDMIEVPKEDFEKLVTKSNKYDKFVAMGYSSPDDIERLEIDKETCELWKREHICDINDTTDKNRTITGEKEYIYDGSGKLIKERSYEVKR